MQEIYPITPYRTKYMQISDDNPKIQKSEKKLPGFVATILHFAPSDLSGYQVCPFADACRKVCLHTAGARHFQKIKTFGRIRKTKMFFEDRRAWEYEYITDLTIQQMRADEEGKVATHRPNGTSDIPWERIAFQTFGGKTVFEIFPRMQFIDYTKYPPKERVPPENYHLTFSLSTSEENARWAEDALKRDWNVTVVFAVRKGQLLPADFGGIPVVDGDEHDFRHLDPPGSIVGLRAKGRALGDTSGFVRHPRSGRPMRDIEDWRDADPKFATFEFYTKRFQRR